jgi:hypothetical protein
VTAAAPAFLHAFPQSDDPRRLQFARDCESYLAGLFRPRHCHHAGRLRLSVPAAHASGTAGLAGRGTDAAQLEPETYSPADREFRHLSAVFADHARTSGTGSAE